LKEKVTKNKMKHLELSIWNVVILILILTFSMVSCFKSKTEIELLENSKKSVEYFYNTIIRKHKYDLLDNFVTHEIELMFGYERCCGSWEFEGDLIGFKNKIRRLHDSYGTLKNYTIISNRYFDAGDYGIYNMEFTIIAEYERVRVKEELIFGYNYRKNQSIRDLKLIAYSSWQE